ncbi:hypothetical protein HPP92_011003 [Vanilla planifolia]|uniref:Uncharacterized protein n=1 Tax=Vanilla planifolia TaxID=51239 RepID=A0A835V1D4_VANPL|nr:hypothetical protein HPP92_011003 [Vanilla planifolia]
MGRSPCCEKVGLKKGPWTPEEDHKLLGYIEQHGHGSWRALPAKAGLQRCGKSCRLRWTNYLRPDIKRGKFSPQEEQSIIQLHALLGNRWSAIATHLPKRTDNEIKNYWNTHLKKRLAKMGIDPVTHKPRGDSLAAADGHNKSAATLSHMAQWESARLEAEGRLIRESSLRSVRHSSCSQPPLPILQPTAPSPPLDVLRAWQRVWPKFAANSNIQGESRAVDLESPSSTQSLSENANKEAERACIMPKSDSSVDAATATATEAASAFFLSADAPSWFTGMLNSSEGSGVDMERGDTDGENNKDYWCGILDMVNSSPTNSAPSVF